VCALRRMFFTPSPLAGEGQGEGDLQPVSAANTSNTKRLWARDPSAAIVDGRRFSVRPAAPYAISCDLRSFADAIFIIVRFRRCSAATVKRIVRWCSVKTQQSAWYLAPVFV
jgi:hypothetical protein